MSELVLEPRARAIDDAPASRLPGWVRPAVAGSFVVVFVTSMFRFGLPADRVMVVTWAMAGVLCFNVGRPWRTQYQLVRDWVLFAVMLFVYDYSRGAADGLGRPIHVSEPAAIDRFLFLGTDPNVWMQQRLMRPTTQWYDVVASIVYMTHFVLPIAIAMILWTRSREQWIRWMRRFGTVLFAGVATYILYPAAPPWYAAKEGHLDPLLRISGRGWRAMELDVVSNVLKRGQEVVNPFAAVPSLHAAFAFLAVVFFLPGRHRVVQALMLLFPLTMAWTLVYSAEHYVIDILLGWVYVLVAMWGWGRYEARHAHAPTAWAESEESVESTEPPGAPVRTG